MPPKRTRAHSPPTMRPTKRKNMRNIDLFIDEEAEEASDGHNSEGAGSQKSEYSLANLGESTLTEDEDDDAVVNAANGNVTGPAKLDAVEAGPQATTSTVANNLGASTSISDSPTESKVLDAVLDDPESAIQAVATEAAAATVLTSTPVALAPITVAHSSPVGNGSPVASVADIKKSTTILEALPAANVTSAANSSNAAASSSAPPIVPPVPVLDPDTNWGYGPKLNKRINRLMTFSNADELIYDIAHVPANAQISAIEDTNGDDAYLLTVPGRKAPITIWLIGTITRTYFRDRDGNLPKSISVNVRALHESSLNAANNLLRTFSTFGPGENPERHDTIRASRWMNTKRAGDIADHIEEFCAVYDAKHAFLSPRNRMTTVFPSDIKKGDLVLLELNLGRYRKTIDTDGTSTKSSPNRRKGGKGDGWTAFFALKTVCLLDDTPKKTDPSTDVQSGTWEL